MVGDTEEDPLGDADIENNEKETEAEENAYSEDPFMTADPQALLAAQLFGMSHSIFAFGGDSEDTNEHSMQEDLDESSNSTCGIATTRKVKCNECEGCLTPECRECHYCLNMKKYGGPGTKKRPCVRRKCLNPKIAKYSDESLKRKLEAVDSPVQKIKKKRSGNGGGNTKKLMTGFILFSMEMRKKLIIEHPNASFGQISRMVGQEWQSLGEEDKRDYETRVAVINEEKCKQLQQQLNDPNFIDIKQVSGC